MTEVVNVCLVGYGAAGRVFHAPLIRRTPGLHLHTVVSSDARKVHAELAHVRVVADPLAAFQDPAIDLVVIASPNASHAALAIAALEAGRHVVVDKPFTTTLDEAHQVVEAARRSARIVSVFQNRRWDSDFLTLQALIRQGALGDIVELHSHFDRHRPQVPVRWREAPGPGSGLWFDLGPHLVDQALQLFGMPDAVQADRWALRAGAEVDDGFHVVLHYPQRRVFLHAGSVVVAHDLRFAVHGSKGSWIKHGLDPQEAALRARELPGDAGWCQDPHPGTLARPFGNLQRSSTTPGVAGDYLAYYRGLRDAITRGQPVPVTADEALQVMRIIAAGIDSADTGTRVALPR